VLAACIREHGASGVAALQELTGVDPRRCGLESPLAEPAEAPGTPALGTPALGTPGLGAPALAPA
jgi:hypothetical protein